MTESNQLVRTEIEEYVPHFNEETGKYLDKCPYEKYTRGQLSVYTCRCISGRTLNNRQQFLQHFKTKAHKSWLNNLEKDDENIKLIKLLRIENGKKENINRLQARHLKRYIRRVKMLEYEIAESKRANDSIINHKNNIINELEDNIKELEDNITLLEETSGCSIEYVDASNDSAVIDWSLSTINSKSEDSVEKDQLE